MPPHRDMPLAVHNCWRNVYDYSVETFTSIQGYHRSDAQLTADAVVATYYTAAGRRRAPGKRRRLPRLGELIVLGQFKRLWTADADGQIYLSTEDNPKTPLLWSQRMRCCVVFPGLSFGEEVLPTKRQDQMLKMWAKGRGARVARSATIPEPMMGPPQAAVAVEYFSDKFTHGGRGIFYVHHHEANVVASQSAAKRPCGSPVAVWLRGGNLRITPDGLEG